MSNVRELEDLIIDAMYLDMLRGKLDQKDGQLEVEYTMGRDLEPGKLESVLAALQHWASTTSSVLTTLDSKITDVSRSASNHKSWKENHDKQVQELLKEVKEKDSNSGGASGSKGSALSSFTSNTRRLFDKDKMDVDFELPVEGKGKNRKCVLLLTFFYHQLTLMQGTSGRRKASEETQQILDVGDTSVSLYTSSIAFLT